MKKLLYFVILVFLVTSCQKDRLESHSFIGTKGGMIENKYYAINVPQNAMPNGYFEESINEFTGFRFFEMATCLFKDGYDYPKYYEETYNSLLISPAPLFANKMILSNGFVAFNYSHTHTEKPLQITLHYELCDLEDGVFCGLSDLQAMPFAVGKKDFNMDNILSDSLNYTPVPILSRDTVKKTITFETTDLTKIYLIAREL